MVVKTQWEHKGRDIHLPVPWVFIGAGGTVLTGNRDAGVVL